MNKHREHLKKLGHDVQTLEKKLEKVLKDDGGSVPKERKIVASNKIPVKSPRKSSVQKVCDQRKVKGQHRASVEVTVKTKCSGKSKKNTSKSIAPVSPDPSNTSVNNKLESHRTPDHPCPKSSAKNQGSLIWDNILKTPAGDRTNPITNAKEDMAAEKESKVRRDEISNEKVGERYSCPNCKNLVSGRRYSAQLDDGGEKVTATNSNSSLRYEVACQAGMKNNLGTGLSHEVNSEMEHRGLMESKNNSQMTPIETLGILLQELNQKVTAGDESMQKLVAEMQLTLGNLVETMSAVGFHSGDSPLSPKKISRGIFEKNSKLARGIEIKGNYVDGNAVGIPKSQKQKIIYEKNFEIPLKTVDDKEIQVNLSLNTDEKLKLEMECLKKQLDMQLKSVDRATAKESEYYSLLVSLIDKVQNLEEQIMEQRKGTERFLLQNNALKEQNSIIPSLQASQELLQKRLQQNLHDYEKLKDEYHLLKLEKEKYCALNDAKDKDIKWFQEEIRNIQLLLEEQMNNIRKVDESETTTNKAEVIFNLIDREANFIKSKLGLAKSEEDISSSYPSIPSQSIISCEVMSTKSPPKKPDSVPPGTDLSKCSTDNKIDHNFLSVPELQSPNSS